MLVTLLCAGFTSAWADTESVTFSEKGYTNGNAVTSYDGSAFSIAFNKGTNSSNAPKYYSTGSAIRCYGGNTFTVSSSYTITEIALTFGSGDGTNAITTDGGTYENNTWTGSASAVVFTIGGTTGNRRIASVTVTYTTSSTDPSISADAVDITYNATSGSIAYTINNGVTGGSLSAEVTAGDWLTLGTVGSSVPFTCSANSAAAARTATVTLTYSYGTESVTKNVTVTQAGNPNVVDNISDITAAGTYAVQGTIVAKSQRGFIVGDGTGYVYYYNTGYDQSAYNIGDKVKLSGSVVAYGGVFEFNNSTTVSATTESNYVAENPSVLSGGDMDTRVGSSDAQLSSYVQYQGTLTVSGTYYNITSIDGATTAMGSISYPINTDWSSLNGKTVTVKGYYVGVSSSKYYNTMLESIEEVVATTPTITATAASLTGFTYEVGNGPSAAQQITIGGLNLTNCWSASLDANSNFEYSFDENDGYFSDSGIGANPSEPNQSVVIYVRMKSGLAVGDYNEAITITSQGAETVTVNLSGSVTAPVVDYATLPFIFDGGKADIENTDGLTQSGLDSDYGSSPKLKFNGADDVVVLKINEAPGTLTFDIKGNSFSGGTFKVQTSEDGTTYTDLKTYTELGDTQNESFNNLGVNVRYIKWIYTEKISGNVALGNITLAKTAAPSAPVWSALPTPTISVGEDYELNLADYVSGYPTPTISITTGGDIASIDANNYFHFTPTAEGYKEFVFFASNSEGGMEGLLSVTITAAVPSVEVSETTINAPADASDGTITVTYHNITLANLLSDVKFYEADGTTETTSYGWIDAEIDNQNNVYYIIDQNTDTNARTAYMKVWARDDNNNDVYSDLITVTQTGAVSGNAVVDEITLATTGVEEGTNTYTDWSGKTVTSDAVYAGQNAGGNNAIQLRSNNNNSGIVTTTSGGLVQKIEVVWNSNTADGRTINIYGSNTAYTAATDLYGSDPGTLIGTIAKGETTLTVTDDYEYIGIRSASGALYLDKVTITWEANSKLNPELSFSTDVVDATIGVDPTLPTLNTASGFNGTVEYSSSDESVAQIMDTETGELRLVKEGTTIITATFAGDNTYKAGSASYTLNVTDNRIATTISYGPIELSITDVSTLTQLAPVVKDADDNVIAYTYEGFPPTVSYEIISDDNSLISSLDNNSGEITLNGVVGTVTLKAFYNLYNVSNIYKPSECTFTITVVDPSVVSTYVALVAKYDGKHYAMNANGGATWGATEVDAVNGKVITERTDAISWIISPATANSTTKVIFKNVSSEKYLNYTSSASLSAGTSSSNWDIDSNNNSWTNNNNRSMVYRESAGGFKNYAISNIGTSDYASDYTHAYTFADGVVRTVTGGNYGTICLPYDVAAEDFSGVKFYKIIGKKFNDTTNPSSLAFVNLEEVTNLEGGVAYLFKADDTATKLIAAYSGTEVTTPYDGGTGLMGTYTKEYIPVGKYVLKSGKIYYVDAADFVYSGANKAYIDLDNIPEVSTNVKGMCLYGEGFDADGIDAMDNGQTMDNAEFYDLAGRRVIQPRRGIYIVNGKKVLVK